MFTYLLRAMATRPYTVEGQHDCYESDWRHAKSPYMDTSLHSCCPSTVYGHTLDRYICVGIGDGNTRHDDYACMV